MFININLKKIFKCFFIIAAILIICIFLISIYKIFNKAHNGTTDTIEITSNNYTNVLKAVHDDLDSYIGKTINLTGYIYRVYDLQDIQKKKDL